MASGRRTLGFELLEQRRVMATMTVNDLADAALDASGAGNDDGVFTLREAIAYLNGSYVPTDPNGDKVQISGVRGVDDRIVFAKSLFDANDMAKITLQHTSSDTLSGLFLERSVVIEAPEGKEVEIAAGASETTHRRVLGAVGTSAETMNATFRRLAFTGGRTDANGGGLLLATGAFTLDEVRVEGNYGTTGGGASIGGTAVEVKNSVFRGNQASIAGGGLQISRNFGPGVVSDSLFEGNSAGTEGGGIAVVSTGGVASSAVFPLLLDRLIVTNNVATFYGGGVLANGGDVFNVSAPSILAIRDTVISHNTVPSDASGISDGGGLALYGITDVVVDSTSIHNNFAGRGGGVAIPASPSLPIETVTGPRTRVVEFVNTTVTRNRAQIGGGFFLADHDGVTIRHSTVTDNAAGVFFSAPQVSYGGGIALDSSKSIPSLIDTADKVLQLDHTIVEGNTHTLNFPADNRKFDEPFAYSPNVGIVGAGFVSSPPVTPATTVNLRYSYVADVGQTPTFTLPFIGVAGQNLTTPGGLSRIATHRGIGIGYSVSGGYVDSGDPAYTPSSLPTYERGNLAPLFGSDAVRWDQRNSPYNRVADGDGVLGPRIDIGAIERQTPVSSAGPRVTNVRVGRGAATGNLAAFYDYGTVLSDPAAVENGAQLFPVLVGNPNVIEITFSEAVKDYSNALKVVALNSLLDPVVGSGFAVDPATGAAVTDPNQARTIRWVLTNPAPTSWSGPLTGIATQGSAFVIKLEDADDPTNSTVKAVKSVAGNRQLDGEWYNPGEIDLTVADSTADEFALRQVSRFPAGSGDYEAGGDFAFVFVVKPGMIDTAGATTFAIDSNELSTLLANFGSMTTDYMLANWFGNAQVDSDDLAILLSNWGDELHDLLWGDWNNDGQVTSADLANGVLGNQNLWEDGVVSTGVGSDNLDQSIVQKLIDKGLMLSVLG